MTDQQLIAKIKDLKKIKPENQWLSLTRQHFVNELELKKAVKVSNSFADWFWYHRLQPAVLSMSLLLILGGGPVLTLKAAQSSLPGEWLYPVKKITEQVQAKIVSDDKKAQIQFEFATRRLEELSKITSDSLKPIDKSIKTKEVINDLKTNLTQASAAVKNLPKEKIAAMAQKTKKIEQNLNQAKADLSQNKDQVLNNAKDVLAQAEKIVEDVNGQLAAVLVEIEQERIASSTEALIEEKIEGIKEKIDINLEEKINSLNPLNETTTPVLIK